MNVESTLDDVLSPTTLGKSAILLMSDPLLSQKLLTKDISQPAKKIANSALQEKKKEILFLDQQNRDRSLKKVETVE